MPDEVQYSHPTDIPGLTLGTARLVETLASLERRERRALRSFDSAHGVVYLVRMANCGRLNSF